MDLKNMSANKVEEAIQLLSAQNELLERQTALLEEFMARIANLYAEQALTGYLQNARENETAVGL